MGSERYAVVEMVLLGQFAHVPKTKNGTKLSRRSKRVDSGPDKHIEQCLKSDNETNEVEHMELFAYGRPDHQLASVQSHKYSLHLLLQWHSCFAALALHFSYGRRFHVRWNPEKYL